MHNHFLNYTLSDFRFNGEQLTMGAINMAIDECIRNSQGCIDEVKSGAVRVNDKEKYFADCIERKQRYINRDFKVSLSFLQSAYYFQTGKSVALLP